MKLEKIHGAKERQDGVFQIGSNNGRSFSDMERMSSGGTICDYRCGTSLQRKSCRSYCIQR